MTYKTADDAEADAARPVTLADAAALDSFLRARDAALIEFYTAGCGICASMEPVVGSVTRELAPEVGVGVMNPRDDPPLIERFDVQSVPLFVCFLDGEPVARRAEGFIAGEDLTAWVRTQLR